MTCVIKVQLPLWHAAVNARRQKRADEVEDLALQGL